MHVGEPLLTTEYPMHCQLRAEHLEDWKPQLHTELVREAQEVSHATGWPKETRKWVGGMWQAIQGEKSSTYIFAFFSLFCSRDLPSFWFTPRCSVKAAHKRMSWLLCSLQQPQLVGMQHAVSTWGTLSTDFVPVQSRRRAKHEKIDFSIPYLFLHSLASSSSAFKSCYWRQITDRKSAYSHRAMVWYETKY